MEATIDITPDLMAGFLDEAAEHLEALNEHLLAFESRAETGPITFEDEEDRERMTEMFRAAHSLKGLTATFGFGDLNRLTHIMETLFDEARCQKRTFDLPTLNILLGAVDSLERLVVLLTNPSGESVDVDAAIARLDAVLHGEAPGDKGVPQTTPAPAAETPRPVVVSSVLEDPELRQLFIETTEEAIDDLTQKLLKLEENAGDEILNDVYRVAHTLKGACGAAGLGDVQELTHQMETAFDGLRAGRLCITDGLMAGFLQVADRLREVVDLIKNDEYAPWSADSVKSVLDILGGDAPSTDQASKAHSQGSNATVPRPDAVSNALGSDQAGYWIHVGFDPNVADRELTAYVLFNRIKSIGDIALADPNLDLDTAEINDRLDVVVRANEATAQGAEAILDVLRTFDVVSVTVESLDAGGQEATPAPTVKPSPSLGVPTVDPPKAPGEVEKGSTSLPKPNPTPAAAKKPTEGRKAAAASHDTIRVDVERLDQLMNLGGELVINRARFQQVEREFRDVFTGKDYGYITEEIATRLARLAEDAREQAERTGNASIQEFHRAAADLLDEFSVVRQFADRIGHARTTMHDLSEAVGTLDRIAAGLQKQVMDTRMVPVGPLFNRFRRVIRDIAMGLGKKISIEIRGEGTELDKRMIDELSDPLTHILRNSADHGIETPEERTRLGKPPVATITLEAYHQGNSICIAVRDDGRGIDLDAVRKKIAERELASASQIEQMSEREIVQYIFHAGFSTAAKVSDLSGRGMGMDIVTTKIAKLNGTVEVDTKAGQGTTVTIKLPLTLAIIASLLTRIGEAVYAIPLDAVAEIITVRRSGIHTVRGQHVVQVRGQVIPIFFLEDVMRLSAPGLKAVNRDHDEWTLVVIEEQGARIGLVVDAMIGQEEVVIKSLAENFRNVNGFVGATIMGDGRVSLILDTAYLFNRNARPEEPADAPAAAKRA